MTTWQQIVRSAADTVQQAIEDPMTEPITLDEMAEDLRLICAALSSTSASWRRRAELERRRAER